MEAELRNNYTCIFKYNAVHLKFENAPFTPTQFEVWLQERWTRGSVERQGFCLEWTIGSVRVQMMEKALVKDVCDGQESSYVNLHQCCKKRLKKNGLYFIRTASLKQIWLRTSPNFHNHPSGPWYELSCQVNCLSTSNCLVIVTISVFSFTTLELTFYLRFSSRELLNNFCHYIFADWDVFIHVL